MGQKVSPIGLRIGVNRDWESKWYAPTKDFAKYFCEIHGSKNIYHNYCF